MYLGPEALRDAIESASLYPIRGLLKFRDYFDEIDAYYHRTLGYEVGVSTGWNNLNELYNVRAVLLHFYVSLRLYDAKILVYICLFLFLRDIFLCTKQHKKSACMQAVILLI